MFAEKQAVAMGKSGKSLVVAAMHVYIFYIHRYLKWDDRVLFPYNKVYRIMALITFSHVFISFSTNSMLAKFATAHFIGFADANVCFFLKYLFCAFLLIKCICGHFLS